MTIGKATDGRLLLLAIASGGSGILALALAGSAFGLAILEPLFRWRVAARLDRLDIFVVSSALALLGALLLATLYYARRDLQAHPDAPFPLPPIRTGSAVLLVLAWLVSSVLVQILVDRGPWKWAVPLLHLLAIAAPVYLLIRLATGGFAAGSRLRFWGSITTGLLLGTSIAAIAEIAVLLLVLTAGASYMIMNPGQAYALWSLVEQLGQASGMEETLALLSPLLTHPLALVMALVAASGLAPVIEELAKSAAPWTIFDRLSAPEQGFAVGALSGAGFALFEGLIASTDITGTSGFVLLMRGGSSLMHVVASALAGWGVAGFRQSGRPLRLLYGYAPAISLHALWNASVVAILYGGIRVELGGNDLDWLAPLVSATGGVVLLGLIALLPFALVILNRRFRAGASQASMLRMPGKEKPAQDSSWED